MTNIYVLRLEGGKFYVGKSDDILSRYQQHLNGVGSAWTRKYRPISLEKTINKASPFDEDKITKEYMSKYGIDNVRGGSYTQLELADTQKGSLTSEIRGATDKCMRCGRSGHYVNNCYARSDISGSSLEGSEEESEEEEEEWECDYCERTFTTRFGCTVHEKSCKKSVSNTCYRCGREGHYSPSCYASRHIRGYSL
jgi:predicted GIY-YIG superfamily endonuclease